MNARLKLSRRPESSNTAKRIARKATTASTRTASRRGTRSEALDPGTQLDFPSPRAARLAQNVDVGLRNGIRIEHGVRLRGVRRTRGAPDHAVDDEVGDMNALRR